MRGRSAFTISWASPTTVSRCAWSRKLPAPRALLTSKAKRAVKQPRREPLDADRNLAQGPVKLFYVEGVDIAGDEEPDAHLSILTMAPRFSPRRQ